MLNSTKIPILDGALWQTITQQHSLEKPTLKNPPKQNKKSSAAELHVRREFLIMKSAIITLSKFTWEAASHERDSVVRQGQEKQKH